MRLVSLRGFSSCAHVILWAVRWNEFEFDKSLKRRIDKLCELTTLHAQRSTKTSTHNPQAKQVQWQRLDSSPSHDCSQYWDSPSMWRRKNLLNKKLLLRPRTVTVRLLGISRLNLKIRLDFQYSESIGRPLLGPSHHFVIAHTTTFEFLLGACIHMCLRQKAAPDTKPN